MKNNKIILGFVGDLASGKGTVAKYLVKKYKINAYRFSTMLRDILRRIYIEDTRQDMQKLSTFLRENYGQDVMSKVIAKDVENDPNDLVVVEGIRRPSDITYLKEDPNFHLIYITADSKIRWERLVIRNENPGDDKKSYDDFLKDEQAEADKLIKELGKTAEYAINNNDGFEDFYTQIEEIVKKIKT
ncbi:AAA family ATPase [Patescibacteria group bacterium]|nr:AAA family ATPase [Patescibacteria group bacterium]MBU1613515.1 AAA family ATPase [Patescibacteria group bacterium]